MRARHFSGRLPVGPDQRLNEVRVGAYVGRVGALAVALGVGSAILGLSW